MEIIENKALLMKVKRPERITNVIPKSAVLAENNGIYDVLVKWGLDEAQVLTNLKLKGVPSPIRAQYNWPGMYKPMSHQIDTADFLSLRRRAYCFNEAGTGKSASVIWAADYLMKKKRIKRVLVVCPLSIMSSAWLADIFKVAMHRTAAVAHGDAATRKKIINADYEFVIINFDGVEIVEDDVAGKFDLIVIDEANCYKSVTTNRWKCMNRLVTPTTWLWMLTGTPASQSPLDAYGMAKLMNPNSVPRYFGAWRDKVMQKITQFKWVPTARATQIVNEVLQPAIRFTKEECLDLPDITYSTREVQMTKQQEKYYKKIKNQMIANAAGEQITAVHAAAAMNKMLQVALGAAYTDSGAVVEFDNKHRLRAMMEVIDEASHKVIVFVPFKHAIEIVTEHVRSHGYTVEVISGDVSAKERTQIFDAFQTTPEPHVLVIQPQSAAHGVTLTAANTICWYGPTFSVETWLQANARIDRKGQQNKMTVVRLSGSPVEERAYKALDVKEAAQFNLMELYKNVLQD